MDKFPWRAALSTDESQDDDFVLTRSVDGTGRGQSFYAETKGAWSVTIPALDEDGLAAFRDFYRTHRADPFEFDPLCDGNSVSAIFGGGYKVQQLAGALRVASVGVLIVQFP